MKNGGEAFPKYLGCGVGVPIGRIITVNGSGASFNGIGSVHIFSPLFLLHKI